MARIQTIKFLRTSAANLATQAAANGLIQGEPYFVDNTSLAIGTGAGTYVTLGGGGTSFAMSFTVDQASVGAGVARWYSERSRTISNVTLSGGVAPAGASLIADLNINGTTAFTTQANRPTLAAGSFYDGSSVPDVTSMVAGDYLTMDLDQVGSSVPGSGIVLTVYFA